MPSLPSKSLRKMRRKPCRRSAFFSIMVHTCSHNPQGYNFYILWSFMIYITSCSALWHKLNTSAFHFITWCHAGNSWDAASFKWFLSELSWMPTNCRKVNKLPKTWNMQNTDLPRIITEEHMMYMFVWFQLDLSPLPWLLPFVRSQVSKSPPPLSLPLWSFAFVRKFCTRERARVAQWYSM
jgi:hypothetical protein